VHRRPVTVTVASALAILILLALAGNAGAVGGTAVGWGENGYGQLGAPISEKVTSPIPVAGFPPVTQYVTGGHHTLGLLSDGSVRAAGDNFEGQLGNGSTEDSDVPVPVTGLSNAIALAAGAYHSLALLADGTVMAWGEDSDGQLGLGTSSGPETCGTYSCAITPRKVPGLANVIAIAAGYYSSMALLADGTVMAWGYDYNGQTGNGIGTQTGCDCVDHPQPVPGVSSAVAIAFGIYGGSALLSDGTVRDWGYNSSGQLGDGTREPPNTCECLGPVTPIGVSGARAVAVGYYHGLALSGGGAQAWGYNPSGQLGNGTTSTTGCFCIPVPAPVAGLSTVQSIASDGEFSLALLSDGTVRSWGLGEYGELGDPPNIERAAPGPVSGLAGVSAIGAGELDSVAVIGPTQALQLSFAGAGAGAVGTQGLRCSADCAGRFAQGQVVVLRAQPNAGTGFAGFSGACAGTGPCEARMDTDQSATATFGPPNGTAITKAKIEGKKKRARFTFTAPGAITGYECKLIRPKKPHKRARKAKKRMPPKFSACAAPHLYKNLRPGKYRFEVRAVDILGADAHPAVRKFTIKKTRAGRHRHA
jgi:alpha-tubulin suppressor-like RCC1 family protein